MPHHYDEDTYGSTLTWDHGSLIIDGKRVLIISGEFHYWRFPDESEWESVLLGYMAAGLNAVRIYFHWGFHSPRRGVYMFDGNRDVDALLHLCARLGLYVLAAPGPYICAETSGGGFPFWLLEMREVRIRHMQATGMLRYDNAFMAACMEWWNAIVPILAKHEITKAAPPPPEGGAARRGCVVGFQVDNELFERKIIPLGLHRHMYDLSLAARNLGVTVPFFHDDGLLWGSWLGSSSPSKYSVDMYGFNLYVIFAPGSVWGGKATDKQFAAWNAKDFVKMVDGIETGFRGLGRSALSSPIFIPELQVGWFNRWGLAQDFDDLYHFYGETFSQLLFASVVAQGCSMASMYTFCGGTNWGALPDPDVYTSYDYAAPLREYRHPSSKLHLLRSGVLQPVRAFEAEFATSRAVEDRAPLAARVASIDGRPPEHEGISLLAKHRESDRGVQLCLLRNLAPGGGDRRLVLRLGGVEVHAEVSPRSAFFAIGHVPTSVPYLLLSGVPILSYGTYGSTPITAGAGGGGDGGASVPPRPPRHPSRGASGVEEAGEDTWFVKCVPNATMCFRGHLVLLSVAELPQPASVARTDSLSSAGASMHRERIDPLHEPEATGLQLSAGCLPAKVDARLEGAQQAHESPAQPPRPAPSVPPGEHLTLEHGTGPVAYPLASFAAVGGGGGMASGCMGGLRGGKKWRSSRLSAEALRPGQAPSSPGLVDLGDEAEMEQVTWIRFGKPCVVRVAEAGPPMPAAATGESTSRTPRRGRAATIVCLSPEDAETLVTYHSAHERASLETTSASANRPPSRFGAVWGCTSAVFASDGASVRVTATGRQQVTILPPHPRAKLGGAWARPAWVSQTRSAPSQHKTAEAPPPEAAAASLMGTPPRVTRVLSGSSPALGSGGPKAEANPVVEAVRTCAVGVTTPPSAALEVPVGKWTATAFDWAALPWKAIDLKRTELRDSLYNGFNGGVSFYRCTFQCASRANKARVKINARHRVSVFCNKHFAGGETVYASAMLKAGAPNGPDMTSFGSHTYKLHSFVEAGDNELLVIVHSFGQSRCPVILDDARNPRGILSAKLKGGARAARWQIAGLDCKQLPNAFATDGVPPEALGVAVKPVRPLQPAHAASGSGVLGGPEPSGFMLEPNDGLVHAFTSFTTPKAAQTAPEGAKARLPLRLHLEGECLAFLSINGTPIARYHGDMGPQHSFFLPDGLLKPAGEENQLTFTGHTNTATAVRVRVRPYDIDLRTGNQVEPSNGGMPLQTTTVQVDL